MNIHRNLPSGPRIFFDPVMAEPGDLAPSLAARTNPIEPVWDEALDQVFSVEGLPLSNEPILPALPLDGVEFDADRAALAALVLALWGTREYRRRRADRRDKPDWLPLAELARQLKAPERTQRP